ncbi:centrosomal protein of 63 kDa-like isoform X2 [Tachysurus fulvidraco]|uniref:centrosomal protein of 63 kDa-like isoform X2 n=1 Tax=Tachysurus fulvidraco TaxID=1234273 RepID=UPI001FEE605A|nr:centrosomal protein of 63 kDa-like isoform X2 [Tachysurus fulvidraco]
MTNFRENRRSVKNRRLRRLLLAARTAATAGIYCCVKPDDGENTTTGIDHTTVHEGTTISQSWLCEHDTEPALVRPKEVVRDQMTDLLVSKIQLEDRVKELEEMLCETRRDCDLKHKEAYRILQSENNEMKKTIIQLKEENEEMKKTLSHKEEFLKKRARQVQVILQAENFEIQETIAQLEEEKSVMIIQIENQRNIVMDMGNLVFDLNLEIADLMNEHEREREAHNVLQNEYDEMKKILKQKEDLLNECEREQAGHSILQAENSQMKKTLIDKEESLNVTLAQAVKFMDMTSKLEVEKTHLTKQVKKLKGSLENMEKQLSNKQLQCVDLANECEREQAGHSLLQAENSQMKKILINKEELLNATLAKAVEDVEKTHLTKQVEKLNGSLEDTEKQLQFVDFECEREQAGHSVFQAENNQVKKTLNDKEELLNVTLAQAAKYMDMTSKLEVEKTHLTKQVKKLKGSLEDMEKQLSNKQLQCVDLANEYGLERETH